MKKSVKFLKEKNMLSAGCSEFFIYGEFGKIELSELLDKFAAYNVAAPNKFEVIEYFKNARAVKCIEQGDIHSNFGNEHNFFVFGDDYTFYPDKNIIRNASYLGGLILWKDGKFAEITKYINDKKPSKVDAYLQTK